MTDAPARPASPRGAPDAFASGAVEAALQRYFGFPKLRPGQEDALRPVVEGRDALVVMPTGAGKSLVYQLGALLQPRGVTVVVSPLIALMKDQVDSLRARGIAAAFVNSSQTQAEQREVLDDLRAGRLTMIYAAPERLRVPSFARTLREAHVALLAVDEAHCVSQWGHDFRPDYLHVASAREAMGGPPCVALTATATPTVQADIAQQLALVNPAKLVTGFNRPNLFFEVRSTPGAVEKKQALAGFLAEHEGDAGLFYVSTRKEADMLTRLVREVSGRPCEMYHAGLPDAERSDVQDRFLSGQLDLVVATNAFGMGVDRGDVRFVAHWAIPPNLESYYQEAGRAGRDGEPAQAILLVAPDADRAPRHMAETGHPTAEEVQAVYRAAGSLAQIAVGSEADGPTTLDAARLAAVAGLPPPTVRAAVQRLAQAGVWSASEAETPLVRVTGGPDALRRFARDAQPSVGRFVEALLRTLPADAFGGWTRLPLAAIATRADLPEARVIAGLAFLSERHLLDVQPAGAGSLRITWAGPRFQSAPVDARALARGRTRALERLEEVVRYASSVGCRRQHLLAHFGEPAPARCGRCDVCLGAYRPGAVTPADEPLLLALLAHVEQGDAFEAWLAGTPARRRDGLLDWLAQNAFVRLEDPLAPLWALTPKGQKRLTAV